MDITNANKKGYAMKQIVNPYLPLNEYIPDGEPHVFGDRVYVFGSHDKENGEAFCLLDYAAYSAPVDDLTQWTYEGVIYKKEQDPANTEGQMMLYAPDVCQGPDGRFYLYYCLNGLSKISVAVLDTPAGRYAFLGYVAYPSGQYLEENIPFDPAVLHDNGKVYVYYGFSPTNINIPGFISRDKILGCSFIELEQDMLTVKQGPTIVLPSETYSDGTGFEGHEYFEAPSIRKIDNLFYLIYSSVLSHELCYAISAYRTKVLYIKGRLFLMVILDIKAIWKRTRWRLLVIIMVVLNALTNNGMFFTIGIPMDINLVAKDAQNPLSLMRKARLSRLRLARVGLTENP